MSTCVYTRVPVLWVCAHVRTGACGDQKAASEPLELEFRTVGLDLSDMGSADAFHPGYPTSPVYTRGG